ncbi:type II secretion system protein GspN [Desulforhopalus sp. 52FAK]
MPVKSSTRFFLYIGYAFIITLVLLYIRFPSGEFKSYCENKIGQALKDTTCSITQIRYHFPISVVLKGVDLHKTTGEQQTHIVMDQIAIRPRMKFWNSFKITGEVYSGRLYSTLRFSRKTSSFTLTDTVLVGLNLEEILKDQGITNRKVQGKLDGSGTYEAKMVSPSKGTGKARIALTKGSFDLIQPVLSLSSINFEKITFDISFEEYLELQQGKLKGENINTSFEGSLNIMNSLQDSRLRLSGLLEPKQEFLQSHPAEAKMVKQYAKRFRKNGLPFKMGGTLSNPTFRFSR